MAPSKVTFENAKDIFRKLHPNDTRPKDCKLKLGDLVRLGIQGNVFTKVFIHSYLTNSCFKLIKTYFNFLKLRDMLKIGLMKHTLFTK